MPSVRHPHRTALLALTLALAASCAHPQAAATPEAIIAKLKTLRSLPLPERATTTHQLALDIRALPAGQRKVGLADSLASLTTEIDPGMPTLTDVTLTLAQALAETPIAPKAGEPDAIPQPYLEVAKIIRYQHVTLDPAVLTDPLYAKADAALLQNEKDIQAADFTLKDLRGKPVTLSALRGKIVLVNFWATWCPPCRKEMPDLDAIYTHFQSQGLVIVSISDEDAAKVDPFIEKTGYHPPVLLDPGDKVHTQFHVDGIPQSFVFNREGKLVAQTIDAQTQRQFLQMLAAAGLHH